ncbi:MAG: cysteine--tRNA ligase [Cyanothece sp. SIO2G6]|nr:cysteine--tRNA ligase [Cyanothece sp. SIO2G6]
MTLQIYNTLTRRKQLFEPLEPGTAKIYCCGVTVYNYCHLGHARCYMVWDTVRRYLMWQGYQVRYVQNFTDIDDKILNRAVSEGRSMNDVAEEFTQAYLDDMARLNVMEADEYPRATHTIDGIQRLIQELEQKKVAYAAGGDVYYAVNAFPEYGKLSGRKLADMKVGASGRVDDDPEASLKRDPFDFALWKGAKAGEPYWESPWGKGRPGWHIECSAMVRDRLGDSIDIHMGGGDLTFPHHENEIAQSEAATGQSLATIWMHNGMVNVDGAKMSKSLGNFTTIRQLLDEGGIEPMVLRMFVLQAQYRKPVDFTADAIASAQNGWDTLNEGLTFGFNHGATLAWSDAADANFGDPAAMKIDMGQEAVLTFQTAMNDDFNTPGAIAVLFDLAKDLRKVGNILTHGGQIGTDAMTLRHQWQTLVVLANVLGLRPVIAKDSGIGGLSDAEIDDLIQQRLTAKKAKNYAESDRIRDDLKAQGIMLVDKPGGVTEWHRG